MNYYDIQMQPVIEWLEFSEHKPSIKLFYWDEKTHNMNINMDSMDSLERFIIEARMILNRKASDVLDKEFGTTTPTN